MPQDLVGVARFHPESPGAAVTSQASCSEAAAVLYGVYAVPVGAKCMVLKRAANLNSKG